VTALTTDVSRNDSAFVSGFVALVGRPNVGKSTLMNRMVGSKVSIVSEKPQTTRNIIRGVVNGEGYQIVLVDTPGIHKPHHRLGTMMVSRARKALADIDVVLFLVDSSAQIGGGDRYIAEELSQIESPVILCLNKIDLVESSRRNELLAEASTLGPFLGPKTLSAVTGEGIDELLATLVSLLAPGPMYYPEGMVSDSPEQFIVGEIIREKVLQLTEQEVPHSVVVEVESMSEREDKPLLDIAANIYVERLSQKGIVIGAGGRLLKEIGTRARLELEDLFNCKVNLQLWVKHKENWRKDERALRRFGYYESE
jgi:GTP-binding protein Era